MCEINNKKYAALVIKGISNNSIFSSSDPRNRDNSFAPYIQLKHEFNKYNIDINTIDTYKKEDILFELHFDVGIEPVSDFAYLVMCETPMVIYKNGDLDYIRNKYRIVFTWDDNLVEENPNKYIKLNIPNNLTLSPVGDYDQRLGFCCMIAGNKIFPRENPRELYSKRVEIIRWFEKNHPSEFDLYGVGWNAPARSYSFLNKLFYHFMVRQLQHTSRVFFPSNKGCISKKIEIYKKYRFAICYENVDGIPGYITEKIFDAMIAGCVPIYWGASNILKYVDSGCFIDKKKYSIENLYKYLKSINKEEYTNYQEKIHGFLKSKKSYEFSADNFVSILSSEIIKNLGIAHRLSVY